MPRAADNSSFSHHVYSTFLPACSLTLASIWIVAINLSFPLPKKEATVRCVEDHRMPHITSWV